MLPEDRKRLIEKMNERLEESAKAEGADLIDAFINFQVLMKGHLLNIEEFREIFDEEYINTKLRDFAFHMAPLVMSMFPTAYPKDDVDKYKLVGLARNVCILMFAGVLWYEKKYD